MPKKNDWKEKAGEAFDRFNKGKFKGPKPMEKRKPKDPKPMESDGPYWRV